MASPWPLLALAAVALFLLATAVSPNEAHSRHKEHHTAKEDPSSSDVHSAGYDRVIKSFQEVKDGGAGQLADRLIDFLKGLNKPKKHVPKVKGLPEKPKIRHGTDCRPPLVNYGKCDAHGMRVEQHIYFRRSLIGCYPHVFVRTKKCLSSKHYCRCSAVGDPHYRTFDGQIIHYYGICKYTLVQLLDQRKKCAFDIRVQNEHRGSNHLVSYTRYIEIEIFGHVYRLHQNRRLFINGKPANIPASLDNRARVFYSGRLIQFVAPTCGVRVSFDGVSNAYVEVSRNRYAGKMSGICGDCNGKLDDFRTKSGKDVSRYVQRYNMIGDSYIVHDRQSGKCGPAQPQPKSFCTPALRLKYVDNRFYCGAIVDSIGPFGNCVRSGRVNVQDLKKDCAIDLCANSADEKNLHRSKCEIFKALEESCAQHGITGMKWRHVLGCPVSCGRNKVFKLQMNPCPKTCENHFFGTQSRCFQLPAREGCECLPGYILDGQICVKPQDCKCLEGCRDRESTAKCRKWKSEGECKRYPRIMLEMCGLTCGFCAHVHDEKCFDSVSTRRCQNFKRRGLCAHSFYHAVCGLTCNLEKCPCHKKLRHETPCNPKTKVKIIRTTRYRRIGTNCLPHSEKRIVTCGLCRRKKHVRITPCNVCIGRRKVIKTWWARSNRICRQHQVSYSKRCRRCRPRMRRYSFCRKNFEHYIIRKWHEAVGCRKCVPRKIKKLQVVNCRTTVKRSHCSPLTKCLQLVTTLKREAINCRCRTEWDQHYERCCCPPPKVLKGCYDRCWWRYIIKYTLVNGRCKSVTKRSRQCVKNPKTQIIHGKCNRRTSYRVDTLIRHVVQNCRVRSFRSYRANKCACEPGFEQERCIHLSGVRIRVRYGYRLIKLGEHRHVCRKYKKTVSRLKVFCATRPKRSISACRRSTCLARITVLTFRRKGCKCVRKVSYRYKRCCCKPSKTARRYCRYNRWIKKTIVFHLVNGWCLQKSCEKIIERIPCKSRRVRKTPCGHGRKYSTKTIIHYGLRKCRCLELNRRTKRKKCVTHRCPNKTVIFGKCNRKLCRVLKTITQYYRVSRKHCARVRRQQYLLCCCPFKPYKRTRCNQLSGNFVTSIVRFHFDSAKRLCTKLFIKKSSTYVCSRPRLIKGKCNHHKRFYRRIVIQRWRKDFDKCRCGRLKDRIRFRRCQCPPPRPMPRLCKRGRYWQTGKIKYQMVGGRCLQRMTYSRRRVKCPPVYVSRTACHGCIFRMRRVRYYIRRCQCVKVQRTDRRRYRCCCHKPRKFTKCIGNVLLQKSKYYYPLRHHRCVRTVTIRSEIIVCNRRRQHQRTTCRGCTYTRVTRLYGVRNCRCVVITRRVKRLACCCPPRRKILSCVKGTQRIKVIQFSLYRGVCYLRSLVENRVTRCPRTRIIRGPCPRRPYKGIRYATYRRIHYVVNGKRHCRCRRLVGIFKKICGCPITKIVRGPCNGLIRRIYRVTYIINRRSGRCIKKRTPIETEFCRCKPWPKPQRVCRHNNIWRVTLTEFHVYWLVRHGLHVHRCRRKLHIRDRRVRCPKSHARHRPCRHSRECSEFKVYQVVHCRCIARVRERCRPCDCKKRNKEIKRCINDKYWRTVTLLFIPGPHVCIPVIRRETIHVPCLKVRVIPKQRVVHRGNRIVVVGYRLKYIYRNCKCKGILIPYEKFIRCVGEDIKTRCNSKLNKFEMTRTHFVPHGWICIPRRSRTYKRVKCGRSYILPTGRCNRSTCRHTVIFVYYRKKNCKCYEARLAHREKCCCLQRPIIRKKRCIRNIWSHVTIKWALTSRGHYVFPVSGSPMAMFCSEVTKLVRRSISCPATIEIPFCNLRTNVYTIRIVKYVKENCHCKRIVSIKKKKCPCRSRHTQVGPCIGFTEEVLVILYMPVGKRCVPITSRYHRQCRCRQPIIERRCVKGRITITTVSWRMNRDFACVKRKTVKIRKVHCASKGTGMSWSLVKVGRCSGHGRRRLYYEKYGLNVKTCVCVLKSRVKSRQCKCPPCTSPSHKCKGKYFLEETKCYRLHGGRCQPRRIRRRRHVHCYGRNLRKLEGHCNLRGMQRVVIVTRYVSHCRCLTRRRVTYVICNCDLIPKFRRKKIRRCLKNSKWQTTIVYFLVQDGHCVRRLTERIKPVYCQRGLKRKAGRCNQKTCYRLVSYLSHHSVNCRCGWRVSKKRQRRCCCPGRKFLKYECRRNRRYRVYRRYRLSKGHCIPRIISRRVRVPCHQRRTVKYICPPNRRSCLGQAIVREKRVVKCRCQHLVVRRRDIQCCCKPGYQKIVCNPSLGVTSVIRIKYVLRKYKCSRHTVVIHRPSNCQSRRCIAREGPCRNHFRTIRVLCHKLQRSACICQQYTLLTKKQRCSCSPKLREIRGKCRGHWRTLRTTIRIFNASLKVCVRRVVLVKRQRCRCLPPRVTRVCIKNNLIRTFHVSYHLTRQFTCERESFTKIVPMRFCYLPRWIRTVDLRCNKVTGYRSRIKYYRIPLNCRCINRVIRSRIRCKCPKTQVIKQCIGDRLRQHKRISYRLRRGKCIRHIKVSKRPILGCFGIKKRRSSCRPDITGNALRTYSVVKYRLIMKACGCHRQTISKTKRHCGCKGSLRGSFCKHNHIFKRYVTHYKIVKGLCRRFITWTSTDMNRFCLQRSKITRTKCRHGQRQYHVTSVLYNVHNCRCRKRVVVHKCDCRCKSRRTRKRCTGKYFILVVEDKAKRQGCRCVHNIIRRLVRPKCPIIREGYTIGKCRRSGSTGYRQIIFRFIVRDKRKCRCVIRTVRKHRICFCHRHHHKVKRCRQDRYLYTYFYTNHIDPEKKGCKLMLVKKVKRTKVCPPKSVVSSCDKKTGKRRITIVVHTPRNCVCQRHVRHRYVPCKCPNQPLLVSYGACNRPAQCIAVDVFAFNRIVHYQCTRFMVKRSRICCCLKPHRAKRCDERHGHWIVKHMRFTLIDGRCIMHKTIRLRRIKCNARKSQVRKCNKATGKLRILFYKYVRSGCKCHKILYKTKSGRCRCKKSRRTVSCNMRQGRLVTTTRRYRLRDNRCLRTIHIVIMPIKCRQWPERKVGHCNRKTGFQRIMVVRHILTAKCKCKAITTFRRERCHCPQKPVKKYHCNRSTGQHVFQYIHYKLIGRFCLRVKKVQLRQTVCLPRDWVRRNSRNCHYRLYTRSVRVGCGCVTKKLRKPCICKCRHRHPVRICQDGYLIYRSFTVRRTNCKCHYRTHERRHFLSCPRSYTRHGHCNIRTCFRKDIVVKNLLQRCRCRRLKYIRRRRCCCPKGSTQEICQKERGILKVFERHYKLFRGVCRMFTSSIIRRITCKRSLRRPGSCRAIGTCNKRKGTIRLACVSYYRHGCKCIKRTVNISRVCVCKPKRIKIGSCHSRTCTRKITQIKYLPFHGRCIEVFGSITYRLCCCLSRGKSDRSTCSHNRLILTSNIFKFNEALGVCQLLRQRRDITPRCVGRRRIIKGRCGKSCWFSYKVIHRYLRHCRCRTKIRIKRFGRCCCPRRVRRRRRCLRNRWVVTTRSLRLVNDRCVIFKSIYYPKMHCPKSRKRYTRCFTGICKRKVHVIQFTLRHCRCVRKHKVVNQRCCCPWGYEVRKCSRRTGVYTVTLVTNLLQPKKYTCRMVKSIASIPTVCSNHVKREYGVCNIRRGNRVFQSVTLTFQRRKACRCISERTYQQRLCNCLGKRIIKRCVRGHTRRVTKTYYTLVTHKRRRYCRRITRIVSVHAVRCPRGKRVKYGNCSKRTGYKRILITHFHLSNCKCSRIRRQSRVQCYCGKQRRVRRCTRTLRTTTIFKPVLVCTKSLPPRCGCKIRRIVKRRPFHCKPFHVIPGPCIDGYKRVSIRDYVVRRCHCVLREKKHVRVECKICKDYVSHSFCLRLKRKHKCSHPKVAKVCKETCGRCYKTNCRLKMKGKFSFKSIPNVRTNLNKRFKRRYFLRRIKYVNLKRCSDACIKHPICVSFDVRKKSKHCYLYSMTPTDLKEIGVLNIFSFSPGDFTYVIFCKRKCPAPRIRKVSKCTCVRTSYMRKNCFRRVLVVIYKRLQNLHCVRAQLEYKLVCECINLRPNHVCNRLRQQGKCRQANVRDLCKLTCSPSCTRCRSRRTFHVCKKHHGHYREFTITFYTVNRYGLCIKFKRVHIRRKKGCLPCKEGRVVSITRCIGDWRYHTVTTFRRKPSGKCSPVYQKTRLPCNNCCPSVEYMVTKCYSGFKRVTMIYWVSRNNCCVLQKETNVHRCHRNCRPDSVRYGSCALNRRLKYRVYFLGANCQKHVAASVDYCDVLLK